MANFDDARISERMFYRIEPKAFTLDGTSNGIVSVASTYGLKVGQIASIKSNTQSQKEYKIKSVMSETKLLVGPTDKPIHVFSDVSALTVSDNATVEIREQKRPSIDPVNIQGMVFEEEPTVALRSHLVDWLGRSYGTSNPVPVQLSSGSIDIDTVNADLSVQLTRTDKPDGTPADAVRIGNEDVELTYTTNDDNSKAAADVVSLNKLIDVPHDDIEITQFTADGDPEVIQFKENTNLKMTLTLTYNAEGDLQRVQRSKP